MTDQYLQLKFVEILLNDTVIQAKLPKNLAMILEGINFIVIVTFLVHEKTTESRHFPYKLSLVLKKTMIVGIENRTFS